MPVAFVIYSPLSGLRAALAGLTPQVDASPGFTQ